MVTYEEWIKDLNAFEGKEQNVWARESLRDKENLHIFGKFFFSHIVKGDYEVPECHKDLIKAIATREDGAIVFPRGFAKSTWIKLDTIHDIVYKLEPVILYISNTLRDAQFHFESIKTELENNNLLIDVYGDLVPPESNLGRKWTNTHFETSNDCNVVARGAGKGRGVNIKNRRPTKIICDDVEDDEQVKSVDRRIKMHEWLYSVIFPSKDPEKGYIKMVGTIISPNCQILKFYKQHGGIFRKGIEDGESIWKEVFTMDKLMEMKKQLGTRIFSQEILNNPINEETARIKKEWIKFFSNVDEGEFFSKVLMFDPQAGASKSADYYGLCVAGKFRNENKKYVLEIMSGRDTQINQAALVARVYQQHDNIRTVGVEKVMAQVAVYQLLLDWKAGRIDLPNVNNDDRTMPLIAIEPKGKDKIARMQMHEPDFENGNILFHEGLRGFTESLVCFPEVDHDDDIDSMMYSLEYLDKTSFTSNSQIGYNTPRTIVGNIRNKKF